MILLYNQHQFSQVPKATLHTDTPLKRLRKQDIQVESEGEFKTKDKSISTDVQNMTRQLKNAITIHYDPYATDQLLQRNPKSQSWNVWERIESLIF